MVAQAVRRMSHTGHKDNEHGVPTYWGKSGSTLQKYITALATTDFLLFGFDVCTSCGPCLAYHNQREANMKNSKV